MIKALADKHGSYIKPALFHNKSTIYAVKVTLQYSL